MSHHHLIRSDEAEWPARQRLFAAVVEQRDRKPVIDRGWWIVAVAALIVLMAIGGLGL